MTTAANLDVRSIDYDNFQAILLRYPSVAPSKLVDLDQQRYVAIPATVAKLAKADEAHITKAELVTLVEWKVSHGKFRPSLKKLAQENSEEHVEAVTREAFSVNDVSKALKALCTLRGVGPATASLLLSVHNLDESAFFSDELFRWCLWEDKSGHGWDRSIKYNAKEYAELTAIVGKLRERLSTTGNSVRAVDCEKVAYVLGKTEVNLAVPVVVDNDNIDQTATTTLEPQEKSKSSKSTLSKAPKKRGVDNDDFEQTTQAGVRRSTRRRQA